MNPAPLLYDFEHEPAAAKLRERYALHYTVPSECARELVEGRADMGLIPIASLTKAMAIVPGCTIASLGEVRSILLLVKNPQGLGRDEALRAVKTIAADAASRSSQAYVQLMLQKFVGAQPAFVEERADAATMLAHADAALLIGDPALLAREARGGFEEGLLWLDVAAMWREFTGLPWVAAVWAVRPEALVREGVSAAELVTDCVASRDAGLAHVEEIVAEWVPRIAVPEGTIRTYLTRNIHYVLDEDCLRTVRVFREIAAECGVLEGVGELRVLGSC